jgi:hypothetical protein
LRRKERPNGLIASRAEKKRKRAKGRKVGWAEKKKGRERRGFEFF